MLDLVRRAVYVLMVLGLVAACAIWCMARADERDRAQGGVGHSVRRKR